MSDDLVQIRIDNRPIIDILGRLMERGGDMSVPFRQIAGVMAHAVEKNFEQEGRPEPWLELSEATKAARLLARTSDAEMRRQIRAGEVDFGRMRILQDSGRLASSITAESDRFSATVGTNTLYAKIHHFGGQAGRGRKVEIPARPFLVLAEDDVEEIVDILERHLVVTG